eukprot:GFUD01022175.1.p1 GENE.GFUD01022175.1~~GFUD01022175.1.p1  ORF type:complete len:818 (+),score=242.63 GFUD01022175.1:73-2454(+)
MALRSERQDSKVDPDKGVYVEMEGIMEVRYASEDVDFEEEREDFMHFQARVREISEDFCHKDKETTMQAYFYCLVCNCDLKSLRPLRDHVRGNKHIRKACEKKRQILGLPQEPQNAPRVKKLKKERPRVDVGLTLAQRLEECGEPAIGLEYISEYINPKKQSDHPMYTCRLEGCKSAWGTSDDMFNHVTKSKHHKCFFRKLNPKNSRIDGLSRADILQMAAEYEEEQGGSEERDYEVIISEMDYEKYMELRDRPYDWTEKKAILGMVSSACNSNMEMLGKKGGGGWGGKKKQEEQQSMFYEEDWLDWQWGRMDNKNITRFKNVMKLQHSRTVTDDEDLNKKQKAMNEKRYLKTLNDLREIHNKKKNKSSQNSSLNEHHLCTSSRSILGSEYRATSDRSYVQNIVEKPWWDNPPDVEELVGDSYTGVASQESWSRLDSQHCTRGESAGQIYWQDDYQGLDNYWSYVDNQPGQKRKTTDDQEITRSLDKARVAHSAAGIQQPGQSVRSDQGTAEYQGKGKKLRKVAVGDEEKEKLSLETLNDFGEIQDEKNKKNKASIKSEKTEGNFKSVPGRECGICSVRSWHGHLEVKETNIVANAIPSMNSLPKARVAHAPASDILQLRNSRNKSDQGAANYPGRIERMKKRKVIAKTKQKLLKTAQTKKNNRGKRKKTRKAQAPSDPVLKTKKLNAKANIEILGKKKVKRQKVMIGKEAVLYPVGAPMVVEEKDEFREEAANMKENTQKIGRLEILFEQESRLLSDLQTVDSKMSNLAQERRGYVHQLLFLSELKKQISKK